MKHKFYCTNYCSCKNCKRHKSKIRLEAGTIITLETKEDCIHKEEDLDER